MNTKEIDLIDFVIQKLRARRSKGVNPHKLNKILSKNIKASKVNISKDNLHKVRGMSLPRVKQEVINKTCLSKLII